MDRANDQGGNGHFVNKVFLPYCVYARESKRTHGLTACSERCGCIYCLMYET